MSSFDRRSFLKLFGGVVAVAAAAPLLEFDFDRAMWVPGAKTFFLPPEKSVVTATHEDLAAVLRALGWMNIGDSVMKPDPKIVMTFLDDAQYRKLLAVGRRIPHNQATQFSNGLVRTRVGDGRMSVTLD